jgi:hypothetical protein
MFEPKCKLVAKYRRLWKERMYRERIVRFARPVKLAA